MKDHYYAILYGNDGVTVRVRISIPPSPSRAAQHLLDHLSQSIEPLQIVFTGTETWG